MLSPFIDLLRIRGAKVRGDEEVLREAVVKLPRRFGRYDYRIITSIC
jgi:hypothetical protein